VNAIKVVRCTWRDGDVESVQLSGTRHEWQVSVPITRDSPEYQEPDDTPLEGREEDTP